MQNSANCYAHTSAYRTRIVILTSCLNSIHTLLPNLNISPALPYSQFLYFFLSCHVVYLQTLHELNLFCGFKQPPCIDDYQVYISVIYPSTKFQMHISFLTSLLGCFIDLSNVICSKQTLCSSQYQYLLFLHSS